MSVFPGLRKRLNWPFPDPEDLQGSDEEKKDGTRRIRDTIRSKIKHRIKEIH
jgi:arsenate reductase